MTVLSKTLRREVPSEKFGPLIVELTPQGVVLREKGRRTRFGPLPFGWIYQTAVALEVEARRRERKRKAKRNRK